MTNEATVQLIMRHRTECYPQGMPPDYDRKKYRAEFRRWLEHRAAVDPEIAKLKEQSEEEAMDWFAEELTNEILTEEIEAGRLRTRFEVGPGGKLETICVPVRGENQ
jgi:hypothetical protein